MNRYDLPLFLHLAALLAAFAASGVVHLAMVKLRDARTAGEGLQWLGLCHAFSRVFPVALLTLLGTGAWMVHEAWTWSAGFVDAGLAGVVVLFVLGGGVEGSRARKAAAALAADPAAPIAGAAAALVRDPAWWAANSGSTGTALGVVFVMTTKPSLGVAFACVAVGLALGACVGLALRVRGTAAKTPSSELAAAPTTPS